MSRFHSAISHLNLNSRSGSAVTVVVGLQRRSQAAVTKTAIEGSDNQEIHTFINIQLAYAPQTRDYRLMMTPDEKKSTPNLCYPTVV
jgi:hypothetical protein